MRGWIKIFPRALADSEKLNALHPSQRYWFIMLLGVAYNEVCPGLLIDDEGTPLSHRTMAHDLRTDKQQIGRAIRRCIEEDLMREFDLGVPVVGIRKYATFQADYRKRGFDLDEIRGRLWTTYDKKSGTFSNKSPTLPGESPPPEYDEMLDYIGYERVKVPHPSTTNSENECSIASGGKRIEDRGKRIEDGGKSLRGEDENQEPVSDGVGEAPPPPAEDGEQKETPGWLVDKRKRERPTLATQRKESEAAIEARRRMGREELSAEELAEIEALNIERMTRSN